MTPNVALVQTPVIDFNTFLTVSNQALGYDVSTAVNASLVNRTDAERFISCLAAMQDRKAKPGCSPRLLCHVSVSVMIAADDVDMFDILSVCQMPFICVDTRVRGVQLAVATGTLRDWRDAVKFGLSRECRNQNVRMGFNRIMGLFTAINVDLWKGCTSTPQPDGTLLLEDKR